MTRFTRFAAVALAGAAFISTAAYAASEAAGKWDLVADVQGQQLKSTMTVAEAAGGYTVDIVDVAPEGGGDGGFGPMTSTISEVAVDGSVLTFKRHLSSDAFQVDLTYKLTATGDSLAGEASSDFGPTAITGTRAK
ncbi:MAG: hypothetical protein H6R45_316 [Proteobacteria bacterium]|nr:hypothetical protein [Pseudomonadota bacterium]